MKVLSKVDSKEVCSTYPNINLYFLYFTNVIYLCYKCKRFHILYKLLTDKLQIRGFVV